METIEKKVKPVVKIQSTVYPPDRPNYIDWSAYIKKEANKNLDK